jgi:hypothetical protein
MSCICSKSGTGWVRLPDLLPSRSIRQHACTNCMQCEKMVLNTFIFRKFRPVFDQKLKVGCSKKKMKSVPVGTGRFSMIPRRLWLIFVPKFELIPNPYIK